MTRTEPNRAVVVGDVTLIPVVSTSIESVTVAGVTVYLGEKRPVALVVQQRGREWRIELPALPPPS